MHDSYHHEGLTDLSVIRAQAERRLVDPKFPEESTIHHHDKNLPCDGNGHDVYLFDEAESANGIG